MALVSTTTLARGKVLALNLCKEGRGDNAAVVEELVRRLERQVVRSEYVTPGEIALRLGVGRQTVVNWIKRGFLPGVKIGGRLVVAAAELSRVEEIALLLDSVDAERLPATAEEIDVVLSAEQYTAQVVARHLEEARKQKTAVDILESWLGGDAAEQKATGEELVRSLDEDRLSTRSLFPPELKGATW